MTDSVLRFKNGSFKILQIADAQELPVVSPDTVRLIRMALDAEKPDLVVFTGDQIYGIHPALWSEKSVRRVLTALLSPVVDSGIPFTVTNGNHDEECGIPNRALNEIYASFPGFVPGEKRDENDPGTFRLPVYDEKGNVCFDIFVFDTHGSAYGGEKNGVNDDQLAWFEKRRGAEREDHGRLPPALVFQHIPIPEFYKIINEVGRGTRGAVEAFGSRKNRFYVLPDEITGAGGFMKESPSVAGENEFGVLKRDGGVLAVAVGHDHNNSFSASCEGIDLIYTQGSGFHVYGPHLKRGVRVFVLDESNPSVYSTYTRTWENLTDERPKEFLLGFLISKSPSSVSQALKWAKRALVFTAAGVGVAAFAAKLFRAQNGKDAVR